MWLNCVWNVAALAILHLLYLSAIVPKEEGVGACFEPAEFPEEPLENGDIEEGRQQPSTSSDSDATAVMPGCSRERDGTLMQDEKVVGGSIPSDDTPLPELPLAPSWPTDEFNSLERAPQEVVACETLKRAVKGHGWKWCWAIFFTLGNSIAVAAFPFFIAQVVTDIVLPEHTFADFLWSLGFMGLSVAGIVVFAGARTYYLRYTVAEIGKEMRLELFATLTEQGIEFADDERNAPGKLLSHLNHGCETIITALTQSADHLLRYSLVVSISAGLLFRLSWRMALTALALCIAATSLLVGFASRDYENEKAVAEKTTDGSSFAKEAFDYVRTVKSSGAVDYVKRHYASLLEGVHKLQAGMLCTRGIFTSLSELFYAIILAVLLYYGRHLLVTEKIVPADIVVFLLYFQLQLTENFRWFTQGLPILLKGISESRMVLAYLALRDGERIDNGTQGSRGDGGDEDKWALKGLNLSVSGGKIVAVVGESGSGKSSIASLIMRHYKPTNATGQILLNGTSIYDYSDAEYYGDPDAEQRQTDARWPISFAKVAHVAQEPALFSGDVKHNIAFNMPRNDDMTRPLTRLAAQMDMAFTDASLRLDNLPAGYETECGQGGTKLSGGERQRIAIARALYRYPTVLVFDEGTSALDAFAESEILAMLRARRDAGMAILYIAHRLSTVEQADIIYVMEKGEINDSGTHEELMARRGLYYQMVCRQ